VTDQYAAIADLYDHVQAYRDRPDVRFFVDAARTAGGPVLEIGCGTGRVLIPVARAGVGIVGLDNSASMLAICRRRMEDEPPAVRSRVELLQGDMRTFDLPGRHGAFALVTLPFRPFQHLLTTDDQLACLDRIHRHLAPRGQVILDLFNPSLEALTRSFPTDVLDEGPPVELPNGRRLTRRYRIVAQDRAAQVNQVELIYLVTHPDGREERLVHAFGMRYLFRFEAEHLLARAGFAVEHLYGGYDRSAFGSTYPGELVFVARKVGVRG
jgi:SAM-dependent methyltransferase